MRDETVRNARDLFEVWSGETFDTGEIQATRPICILPRELALI